MMREQYRIGDLVHIPQAVVLIDCASAIDDDPQMTIPLQVHETQKPEIGVVMNSGDYGYLRVLVSGKSWTVKNDRVYTIQGGTGD